MPAEQLNFQYEDRVNPKYRMDKILPQSGGQSATIGSAGGESTIFELPVICQNLHRSLLRFDMTPAAQAATFYSWIFKDSACMIRQIQLLTRGGQYLCDLNDANIYTHITFKSHTKLSDMLAMDTYSSDDGTGLFRCSSGLESSTDGSTFARRVAATPTDAYRAYIEAQYIEPGQSANAAVPTLSVTIPMKMIYNTIFSLDKDLYFGEVLQLRIVWGNRDRVGFKATSATDYDSAEVVFTADVNITNLSFWLAVETNPDICNVVKKQVESAEGLNVLHDFVYSNKRGFTSATSQNVIARYNRSQGMHLKKIIHAIYDSTESTKTAYEHSNLNQARVQSFYTTLDSERLQQFNVTCSTYDDYNLLKDKLAGSCITDSNVYEFNWFWEDDWSDLVPDAYKGTTMSKYVQGLDLSKEREWVFVGTCPSSTQNHYTFAVVQRLANISRNGIVIV